MATIAALPGYVAGTWDIDPVHSEVGFSVRHMMVSKVRGKFGTFTGEIVTGETPRAVVRHRLDRPGLDRHRQRAARRATSARPTSSAPTSTRP